MRRKRKGFTLVELLVVIAIIALLMGILMPALARVRAIAHRLVCGTNLSGIGKAMLVYSNDHDEDYPRAGRNKGMWTTDGGIDDWKGDDEVDAYGRQPCFVTITSSFFLLIKHADVTPKNFICRGDAGTKEFKLSDIRQIGNLTDATQAWDFGPANSQGQPGERCSYSYHMPYSWQSSGSTGGSRGWAITSSSNSSSPLCADRNPYLDKNAVDYIDGKKTDEDPPTWVGNPGEYRDQDRTGNSASHQQEGQNVLFQDSHVSFERYPNVGIEHDNIWKCWEASWNNPTPRQRQLETVQFIGITAPGTPNTGHPKNRDDAFLVNETNKR